MNIEKEILIVNLLGIHSVHKLATDLAVSRQTIYNIARRHGIESRHVEQNAIVETYNDTGSISDTATKLNISASTVSRALRSANVRPKRGRPNGVLRDTLAVDKLSTFSPDKWSSLSDADKDMWTLEILSILKRTNFPYDKMLSREASDREIYLLRSAKIQLDKVNIIRSRHNSGLKICAPFFPNRYAASSRQKISVIDAWRDDRQLLRAIRFQLDHGDPVLPHRIRRALSMHLRTPTIFRPAIARFIYERYCPKGGLTWDPCTGYGGRLLGAFVAGVNYIGTDVEQKTVDGNQNIAAWLGYEASIHHTPAESFDPPTVDIVFTSPPYFNREKYGESEPDYGEGLQAWINGFLQPVCKKSHACLKPNGRLVLNIADLKERRQRIPLVQRTIDCAVETGFKLEETIYMPLAPIHRVLPMEPILVFHKI